jgi:outer membrane murein-binding lipoprotein Lpp
MRYVAVAVLLLVGGCSSGPEQQQDTSLSKAWCSDLAKGLPPLGMLMSEVRKGHYASGADAAQAAYSMTSADCPDELTSNQQLRAVLQSFGVNPDS